MSREEIAAKINEVEQEAERLRHRLEHLQEVVQNAPGSHRSGTPPPEVLEAEREIRTIVLGLVDLDRKHQELTVAESLG